MNKIVILYTDAGGGHKSTALTLQELMRKHTNWEVHLINPYRELCAEFDIVSRLSSISAEDLYNRYISEKNSALIKLLIISAIFKINLALPRKKIVHRLTRAWQTMQPDMIISVTPFINAIVADSVTKLPQPIPFVTLVTDFQECCKHIWITTKNQKLICCSEKLSTRALQAGVLPENLFRISGMLVAGRYYAVLNQDKEQLYKKLGLQTGIPTVVVTFGSHGSEDMITIAKNMRNYPGNIQMVFICGYDQRLQQTLRSLVVDYPMLVTGFVHNVEEYMYCADLFIGKPGGLSVAEAAIMQLPLILKYNLFSLIHERHNAQWVLDHNLGVTVKDLRQIQHAVQDVLDNAVQYASNLQMLNNQAYFEILPILQQLLGSRSHTSPQTLPLATALG